MPQRAIELLNRGRSYKRAGDYAAALPFYKQALEEVGRATRERGVPFAHSLANLGLLLLEMGRYADAEPLLRRALDVVERAADATSADRSVVVNNLAGLYQQMGQDSTAEPLFARALALERAMGGEETADFAQVLNNLALSIMNLGRYEEAEPMATRAVDLYRRTLPPGRPELAQSLNNLALLHERTGRYADADRLQRESVAIAASSLGARHPQLAIALGNLARLQQHMGRLPEAEELFKQSIAAAIQSLGEVHVTTVQLLGNLGMLYHDAGRWGDAKQVFEAEAEVAEALRDVNPQLLAAALNHLGLVHLRLQDYDEAGRRLKKALEVCGSGPATDSMLRAAILNNMALWHQDAGRYTEAEALFREVGEIRRTKTGDRNPEYEQYLFNLALTVAALGRIEDALDCYEKAADIDDQLIAQVFGISADSERLAMLDMLWQRLCAYVSLIWRYCATDPKAVSQAFDFVLRRKGVGTEIAAAQRTAMLGGKYPDLDDEVAKLAALSAEINRRMMAGPGPEGTSVHSQRLAELTRKQSRLEADLAARMPELQLDERLRTATHAAIAAALPPDAVLVEFVRILTLAFDAVPAQGQPRWGPARYLAFVVHGKRPDEVGFVDVGSADEIDRLIASARDSIAARGGGRARTSILTELRRLLFDPLLPALDDRRRVIISPDGELTTWPFEVLTANDGTPLIEEYTFSYLSVGRDILRFGTPPSANASASLVVADPDYDLKSTDHDAAPGPVSGEEPLRHALRGRIHFASLPGTRVEGERIASLLETPVILGGAASESLVKGHKAPRVLHIATHGFFLPSDGGVSTVEPDAGSAHPDGGGVRDLSKLENPLLRSGLALAGANTWLDGEAVPADAEDGLLTAADVSGLDLQGTELVVLSACQTGLGQVRGGEGVFGLRRAFVLAGARTLVMSLWEIPDKETVHLMEGFYRRALAGLPRAAALREAQLELRATRPNPIYWGAFICQGDPGPLST
jgi:CHAT domain-containing protein/Tfp pilus assembly protein PilF